MHGILATRNPSKARQIGALLAGLPITIISLDEAGIEGAAEEDGTTLEENAFKKARYAHERSGLWSFADDSGIYIDALDGRPGIHAARWAGDVSTDEIMHYTLAQIAHVAEPYRTATFRTVAVAIAPDGTEYHFLGEVHGSLRTTPSAAAQPNMPYSPLFVPLGHTKSWTEMTVEEENAISHRGKAFAKLRDFLIEKLG